MVPLGVSVRQDVGEQSRWGNSAWYVALLVVLAASSKVLDTQFPWGLVVVEFGIAFQQGPGININ